MYTGRPAAILLPDAFFAPITTLPSKLESTNADVTLPVTVTYQ